jgi:hypothetical protein
MRVLERWHDQSPHVLVAPESVRKHDWFSASAEYLNVVASGDIDGSIGRA